MIPDDIPALQRAHDLFSGAPAVPQPPVPAPGGPAVAATGAAGVAYRGAGAAAGAAQAAARAVDAAILRILTDSARNHERARLDTAAVLAAARADRPVIDNPVAAREMARRRVTRLRTQRRHVLAAHRRSRHRRAALSALRYRSGRRRAVIGDGHAGRAVRAALSRLGSPYVWGAAGPDQFDCSGLVAWSYAQAGVPLPRTTYDQINVGLPVARADVRPGDLVFPHTGHVQMAIGDDRVIEAPYAGATVRISPIGPAIAIRRPG